MSYLQHFASSPSTVATVVVLLLLSAVVASVARRRRTLVFLTGVAGSVVGGLTLAPAGGWTTFAVRPDPWAAVVAALRPHASDLWAWGLADGPANVALYVPLGLTLGLLLRRPVLAVVVGASVSLAIEGYQAATGTRVGVFADVVANSLGTAAGAALAAVVLLLLPPLTPTGQRISCHHEHIHEYGSGQRRDHGQAAPTVGRP